MRFIKKLMASVLIIAMLSSFVILPASASSYKDVSDNAHYAEAVEALTTYGVVSGYAGYYNPSSNVTRAEFAKMVTLAAGLEDEVYSNAGNRRFDDVPLSYWGNGYINTAAINMLIVGYPDGRFMPERKITFAEAVTVLLRAMNYTSADLGDNWPYAYMIKAKGMGLTDGINLGDNSYISRGDLAVVINRALQSPLNGSSEKLISKMEIKMTDEVLIVATKNEDAGLAADEVKTSAGTFKIGNTSLKFTPLTKAELVLDDDQKVINFNVTYTPKKAVTTVDSYVDGTVYFENGSNSRSLGVTDGTPVYSEGVISNYGSFKSNVEDGTAVSILYDNNGSVEYLIFNSASYTEAVAVKSDIYTALASVGVTKEQVDSATVIRDGEYANLEDVQKYDVAYYLKDNSTIYLYSDKVSGVYNEAYPNKANVTSVEISGNVLELETQSAVYKLGEKSGSYKLKSRVTALLGRTGKIVDVVDLGSASVSNYGILLSYGTEVSNDMLENGRQNTYITVINGEGNTSKYKTLGNYSEKIGDVGKLSFDNDGNAIFSSVMNSGVSVSGVIDKNNRKIGNKWLSQDAVILERVYAPETKTGTAIAKKILLEDIPSSELTAKQVVYAVTSGSFGDISLLVVENVTKAQNTYGILTSNNSKVTSMSASGSYTVLSAGQSRTYLSNFSSNIPVGSAVALVLDGNSLESIKALPCLEAGRSLTAIDFSRVKVGDKVYMLGDDVQIYKKSSSGKSYTSISIYDAESLVGKTVNLYADTSVSQGGMVRVITVN